MSTTPVLLCCIRKVAERPQPGPLWDSSCSGCFEPATHMLTLRDQPCNSPLLLCYSAATDMMQKVNSLASLGKFKLVLWLLWASYPDKMQESQQPGLLWDSSGWCPGCSEPATLMPSLKDLRLSLPCSSPSLLCCSAAGDKQNVHSLGCGIQLHCRCSGCSAFSHAYFRDLP